MPPARTCFELVTCCDCGDQFNSRFKRSQPDRRCKTCRAYIAGKQRRARNAQIMLDAKSGCCVDCGGTYPSYVLEFHHRDPSTKSFNIGGARMCGEEQLREEIAKCDVICANCHLERHHCGR